MLSRQNYIALYLRLHKRLLSSTSQIVFTADLPANAYKPEIVEKHKYEKWEADCRFQGDISSSKPTFSMVLPPPNVTGKLHLGHALACTVQDVIARYKRSTGHNVLWLPGTDHAGIATQGVVEKYLKTKDNITRHDIGRERFIKEVWSWKEKHGNTICNQLRTLGCSLDWSRQTFTMDAKHTHAVNTAFIQLFSKGLIYRRKALINWCHTLKSTVSDIEVDNVNITGPTDLNLPSYDKPVKFGLLYEFAYKIVDSDEEIVVSTTMPETMLGDTAIAVHPDDQRYQNFRGKHAHHPFLNRVIPIITDDFVDMNFGAGAVKITPAHSKVDYAVAKQHNLPMQEIIGEDGLIKNSGKFNKVKRYHCREILVDKLDTLGLLRNVVAHQMTLPICSRSGDVIDYLPKEQWFLKCSKLNEKAAYLVRTGQLKIEPDKFVNYWLNWTGDDRDWCISRQLWWGHQIPAYKCSVDNNVVWMAAADPKSAKEQASKFLRSLPGDIKAERDTDVLDTWFSSGIYPFASLGWPENKPLNNKYGQDFKKFYPLSLMATGHDILGFWVHRMVILGLELTGKLPFNNVLLHGIVCDSKGAKMSKSRGNVIDPVDVITGISLGQLKKKSQDMKKSGILSEEELQRALAYHKSNFFNTNGIPQCGVDALRFTLLSQDVKSHFINFDVAMCNANKLFCNKIWQSTKYVQIAFAKLPMLEVNVNIEDLSFFDRWILSRLANMVDKVNASIENNDFHLATKALRALIYSEFCDVYLEATKPGFEDDNPRIGFAHAHTLSAVLHTSLRCLAPFMVYLTDEVIPKIPSFETNIIHNFADRSKKYFDFPRCDDFSHWKDGDTDKRVEKLLNCVSLVREIRALYNITNKFRPTVCIKSNNNDLAKDVIANSGIFKHLTRSRCIEFDLEDGKQYASGALGQNTEIFVEILGESTEDAILSARDKLQKRITKLEDTISKMESKLRSNNYMTSESEWNKVLEKEHFHSKKLELEKLQRLILGTK